MPEKKFQIIRISDSKAIENILKICEDVEGAKVVSVSFGAGIKDIGSIDPATLRDRPELEPFLRADTYLLDRISIVFQNEPREITQIKYLRTAEGFDEVSMEFNNCPLLKAGKVLTVVQSHFKAYNAVENLEKMLGPELADFYRIREAGLMKLEGLSQRLIEDNEAYRRDTDAACIKKETAMHEVAQKKEVALEEEKGRLYAEVDKRKKELDERENQLDDRNNTHVRRQLRNDMKGVLEKRSKDFRLTAATVKKRRPIHLLFLFVICVLAVCMVLEIAPKMRATDSANVIENQTSTETALQIVSFMRLPMLSVTLVVTAIFYIRWVDRWAQKHADEEFHLKRLDLDIDRASWLVEMVMEWQEEKGTTLPRELLDRLSYNLFSDVGNAECTEHPYEQLIKAILSVSAEARIPIPGGGEITLDKKGIRSLAKHGES